MNYFFYSSIIFMLLYSSNRAQTTSDLLKISKDMIPAETSEFTQQPLNMTLQPLRYADMTVLTATEVRVHTVFDKCYPQNGSPTDVKKIETRFNATFDKMSCNFYDCSPIRSMVYSVTLNSNKIFNITVIYPFHVNRIIKTSIKNFSYGRVTSGDLIEHNVIEVVIYNIDGETCTALTGVTNVITYFAQISVVDADGRYFTCTGGGDVSFTPGIKEQNVKVIKLK